MPNKPTKSGSELFIVDNSDSDWKVRNYLHDWADIAHTFDIATYLVCEQVAHGPKACYTRTTTGAGSSPGQGTHLIEQGDENCLILTVTKKLSELATSYHA